MDARVKTAVTALSHRTVNVTAPVNVGTVKTPRAVLVVVFVPMTGIVVQYF